jgi:hypothetical protein
VDQDRDVDVDGVRKRVRPHVARLLVPAAKRRGSDSSGYTDIPALAMRDEPEALSRDDYERHVLGRAFSAAEQQAALEAVVLERERRVMSIEERFAAAQVEARRRSVDVSGQVRLLAQMLAHGKEPRHLERRLGELERKAFRQFDPGVGGAFP